MGVEKFYDLVSPFYDLTLNWIFHPGRKKAISLIHNKKNILEIGCGTAYHFDLYPKRSKITAVDISKRMISKAVNNNLENESLFINSDFMEYDFQDKKFEVITMLYSLSTFEKPLEVIDKAYNLLDDNGDLIIVNSFDNGRFSFAKILTNVFHLTIGFNPNLSADKFRNLSGFIVKADRKVNLFNKWTLLHLQKK